MSSSRPPNPSETLTRDQKLQLAAFVCWYAWADKVIQPQERRVIDHLIAQLGLTGPDALKVQGWLTTPPPMEAADPAKVPPELRKRFVEEAERVVVADGKLTKEELHAVQKLKKVLLGIEPPPARR
jgi:uncharacterized tellurite resistance protein B-like protein